ncbi:helix-turn-helix domain-containing protein [Rhizobium phaseoli]|uniref:helix-turn-helix domain-containing protein n=1 Tax=Rhizobium phaseoli TaxID=396 RepID=UPI0025555A0F|nr:helix-turn-helix transcriptional regulator [Rhizobium phaseoli]MDK4729365.1 helix-turn-helix transcriptional regulator [Rhizobium phaseoli]
MLDKPKRRPRRPNLKAADIPRIQALIDANPECTCASIADMIGWHRGNMARFTAKHGLLFPRKYVVEGVRAGGLAGEIIRKVEDTGLTQQSVAKQLQVDQSLISRWRAGKSEPSLFLAVCLAEIAGYRLVLEKVESPSSVSDLASNSA